MHNSATVRNDMAGVVPRHQQKENIINRSSEIYQLDEDDYDKDVDSLSLLVDLVVNENGIRVFKGFTPLSRDDCNQKMMLVVRFLVTPFNQPFFRFIYFKIHLFIIYL